MMNSEIGDVHLGAFAGAYRGTTHELQLNGNGSKETMHHDKLLPNLVKETKVDESQR